MHLAAHLECIFTLCATNEQTVGEPACCFQRERQHCSLFLHAQRRETTVFRLKCEAPSRQLSLNTDRGPSRPYIEPQLETRGAGGGKVFPGEGNRPLNALRRGFLAVM